MTERALDGQIEAAATYESLFVPALFAGWTSRVADAARVAAGQRALDVACGTGALTRVLAARVGSRGAVAGVDIAPGMVAVAQRVVPDAVICEGRAEALPFDDRSFDVVTNQFGLMFVADRGLAVREMLRVLRPGGRLGVAVWASLDDNPAFADEVALLERLAGPRAADALRWPFALGDGPALARLVQDAGAVDVEVKLEEITARFPTIRSLVEADVRGWLPLTGVALPEAQITRILDDADTALAGYAADGAMCFATRALVLSGQRPA